MFGTEKNCQYSIDIVLFKTLRIFAYIGMPFYVYGSDLAVV